MKIIGLAAAATAIAMSTFDFAWADAPPPASAAEQLLVPPYPATPPWKKITDRHDDKLIWIEWIPADQTEDDVRDILTEQVFFQQKGQNPNAFVTGLLGRINGACRATRLNGPKAQTELGYPVAYAQAYCVGSSGKDIDIFIKAIGGHDALYVVQREFRRPATPGAEPGLTLFAKDELPLAKARLEAQGTAAKFLDGVKLCAHGISADQCASDSSVAGAAAPAAPDSDSTQIDGWPTPGKTTADEVSERLGRPTIENHSDPFHLGQYSRVYARQDGVIFAFLFDKNDLVVRMRVYKQTGP